MKLHVAELSINHNHVRVQESKETPWNSEMNLKDVDIDIPAEESIETLKAGGAEIVKQLLGILAEDCKQSREIRRLEAEARIQEAHNEAERLRQASANKQ